MDKQMIGFRIIAVPVHKPPDSPFTRCAPGQEIIHKTTIQTLLEILNPFSKGKRHAKITQRRNR